MILKILYINDYSLNQSKILNSSSTPILNVQKYVKCRKNDLLFIFFLSSIIFFSLDFLINMLYSQSLIHNQFKIKM